MLSMLSMLSRSLGRQCELKRQFVLKRECVHSAHVIEPDPIHKR